MFHLEQFKGLWSGCRPDQPRALMQVFSSRLTTWVGTRARRSWEYRTRLSLPRGSADDREISLLAHAIATCSDLDVLRTPNQPVAGKMKRVGRSLLLGLVLLSLVVVLAWGSLMTRLSLVR